MFADTDLKFDQPQAEVVFDRDKVRVAGRRPGAGRPRPLDAARRQLRQPLQHPGPQLQGHPAGQARRAADRRPARATCYVTGRGRQAGAAVDVRHAQDDDRAARAEALPAAQRRAHPGRRSRPACRSTRRSSSSRTRRKQILPQGFTIDYAGESRQLRTEGEQVPRHLPAVGDPDLPRARRAVRELPRSVHHPRGLGAAGARRARCSSRSSGFTTLNIYSQVGLITLVGLVSKNGILIVEFANHLQEQGTDKLDAVIEAAGHATAADPDDDGGDGRRALAARASRTAPAPARATASASCSSRGMIIGTAFTLFVVPSIYMLVAKTRTRSIDEEFAEHDRVGDAPSAIPV